MKMLLSLATDILPACGTILHAADHPDIVKSLGAAIDEWLKQTGLRLPANSI